MGVVVTFNYGDWLQLFPQFSYITQPQAQMYFDLATTFCRNDGGGPVCNVTTQTNLLNLMTAHLVQLMAPAPNGDSSGNPLVGRINSASEGSVSVGTENQYPPGTVQWYQQTQWGSIFYSASAPYRTMRYLPGYVRPTNPWPIGSAWPLGTFGGGWRW